MDEEEMSALAWELATGYDKYKIEAADKIREYAEKGDKDCFELLDDLIQTVEEDDNGEVRLHAADAIKAISEKTPASEWLKAFEDYETDLSFVRHAYNELEKIGFDKIPKTEEEKIRIKVRGLLSLSDEKDIEEIVKIGKPALPVLMELMKIESEYTRELLAEVASIALCKIADETTMSYLIEALKIDQYDVMRNAAQKIEEIGYEHIPGTEEERNRIETLVWWIEVGPTITEESDVAEALDLLEHGYLQEEIIESVGEFLKEHVEEVNCFLAGDIVKKATSILTKDSEPKTPEEVEKRREELAVFESIAAEIEKKITPDDKKSFPVKRQEVRKPKGKVKPNTC